MPTLTSEPSDLDRRQGTALAPVAKAMVDILILTYNERVNLPHALASVTGWVNNVFVLDSGSTDGTQEYAREAGATVVEHAWEGYARQKNWGLDNLPFGSPWIFILDADETITPELRQEITAICGQDPNRVPVDGYYVNRYLIFLGKRIRHCGYFPSWNLRLFKRGKARYEDRPVHEHMILDGREGYLKHLMHHEDRRGLEFYIAKHNRYSTLEAETIFYQHDGHEASLQPSLFGNAIQRRRFFKNSVYPRLPGRWLGRFVWMYFIRAGILDGMAGLRFCLLISSHELFTSLKLLELRKRTKRDRAMRTEQDPGTTRVQIMDRPGSGADLSVADPTDWGLEPSGAGVDTGDGVPVDAAREPAVPQRTVNADVAAVRESRPWTFRQNIARALWMLVRGSLFRLSFHNWYAWRRLLLRLFGAKVAKGAKVRPTVSIEIPWNVDIGEGSVVGDYAILYSLGKITIGKHVVISQYAHLCAGTHDYTRRSFPLLRHPIYVGDEAWVAADTFVGPGVTIGDRAVLGARSTAMKDVPADQVYAGSPARFVKPRVLSED